jgi:hypothetical protein
MLAEGFALVIQLPPLVFGPALPPPAFAPPRALVCPIQELGRIQEPASPRLAAFNSTLDPRMLTLAPERYLFNRPVDLLLFLAAAYAGRATWEDRSFSARFWQASGAVTPVLIPPMAPPFWSTNQR